MNDINDSDRPIKWATMIPLIGGSAIGCKKATGGVAPMFNLSYSAFAKNESHLKKHWPKVPHIEVDKNADSVYISSSQNIDFVNSVCSCAGLSMLNVSRTGKAARGSEAEQNRWMIDSADFILPKIQPKVLFGENALGLFTNVGKDLVEKLRQLGEKHGYSFSMMKTDSQLHGLPQQRIRTFYFFWKSPTVPILQWKNTTPKSLVEYLSEIPSWATLQDKFMWPGKPSETNLPYKFVLEKEGLTHKEFSKRVGRTTINKYLEKNQLFDECLTWLKKNHPTAVFSTHGKKTFIDKIEHIKRKLTLGLGYWDDSVKFMGDYFR